ncbi:MAG TPA: FAD-dependent oxidoreductase [Allosphingosinicella sp.]
MRRFEVAIVGAGIAGASLAAEIAPHRSILLLEAEDRPGYHSTGRSAAFWAESYGGPLIQPLTSASGPFLAEHGFLRHRGALHLADSEGEAVLERMEASQGQVSLEPMDRKAIERMVPGVWPGWDRALFEASCADIDVAALHAYYLKTARQAGAEIVTGARVTRADRKSDAWVLETPAGDFECSILANAAGAWADEVASLAGVPTIGIVPHRRTIAQLSVDPPASADLPLVIDARERFYFKPEAGGRLWVSPHDETPCEPCDCAPEEMDVAVAIDWLGQVVEWRVEAVEHRWAGLRSFAPDRLPVYGFAAGRDDFFWCAGQGGFGIQTAPAAARMAAALLLGRAGEGVDPGPYLASRFA